MRFLFVDRIVDLSSKVVRGLKHVTHDDYYLCTDEQGLLCFVPSLIGETLGQLAAWQVMAHNQFTKRPVAGVVACAQVLRPAYVGETIQLESWIDQVDDAAVEYHSTAYVGQEPIFRIEGALGPLLPMEDFIDPSIVRAQFQQILRPGDWENVISTDNEPVSVEKSHRLNHRPLFQFDRIRQNVPGEMLVAEKLVNGSAVYFSDHFPNKPVLPMTVLLESTMNLARDFVAQAAYTVPYRICEIRRIKMNDFVYPGDCLQSHLQVKRCSPEELVLHARSTVDGKRVCILDIHLKP